MFHNLHRNTL